MMKLVSTTTNRTLIPNLHVADTTWSRMVGLLGRDGLAPDEALYIPRCASIHTFFMKFPIDVVFVNSAMEVTKTVASVGPGRLVFTNWATRHVIEFSEGFLAQNPIQIGEKLHVDHSLS